MKTILLLLLFFTSFLFSQGTDKKSIPELMFISKDSTNIMARIELARLNIRMKKYSNAKNNFKYLVLLDSTNTYYAKESIERLKRTIHFGE